MRVKVGSGFEVMEIRTGFENSWVQIEHLPQDITEDSIRGLFKPFGQIEDVLRSERHVARVNFSDPLDAKRAVSALNGSTHFGTPLVLRQHIHNITGKGSLLRDTTARICWDVPGIVGYGGYDTLESAEAGIARANRGPFKGNYVHATLHKSLPAVGNFTVKFRHLPIGTTKEDMKEFGEPSDMMWERSNYENLPKAIDGIRYLLDMNMPPVSVDVPPGPYRSGTVTMWAHFADSSSAKQAAELLHLRKPQCTNRTRIFAHHEHSLTYQLPLDAFQRVQPDIQYLRMAVAKRGHRAVINVHKADSDVTVRLCAEDLKELGQLKAEFEMSMRGEVLRQSGQTAWDGFFLSSAGYNYLRSLQSRFPGLTIKKDRLRRNLILFGPGDVRQQVKEILAAKINELQSSESWTIPLPGHLVGAFMTTYLAKLQQELGSDNVFLDLWDKKLAIRGTAADFEVAQRAVKKAQSSGLRNVVSASAAVCPVCFEPPAAAIKMRCGHSYCRSCLVDYLNASIDNRQFPLTCVGADAKCIEPIPLAIARNILSPSEFEGVVVAAFSAHIQSHRKEFHYCPTPDCSQIYRSAPARTILQCPMCLLRICPTCHVEYHDDFDCPDPEGNEQLFKQWVSNHDVQPCPGCKALIERIEGCNHVICTQCHTHICWECGQTFSDGSSVYGHMRTVHGNWGLGPIDH
jgi:hypothetical protein